MTTPSGIGYYVFAVDSVWAGPVLPRIEVVSCICADIRFDVGQAYLFSWEDGGGGFDHPTEWTSVAWRLGKDDRLDLLSFGPALMAARTDDLGRTARPEACRPSWKEPLTGPTLLGLRGPARSAHSEPYQAMSDHVV